MAKKPKSRVKGKKKKKARKSTRKHDQYEIKGNKIERKGRVCPKCGAGVFMGEHEDRYACGKCGYMEKKRKNSSK
ncbi:30S ribosomal protein S27ae [Candidatus Woesearchaeota archaeon]|nr:30S ribosomal protein S27ae [Candidatus Woesearchaeota archaeon]